MVDILTFQAMFDTSQSGYFVEILLLLLCVRIHVNEIFVERNKNGAYTLFFSLYLNSNHNNTNFTCRLFNDRNFITVVLKNVTD